jgi:hypothetical protein
MESTGAIPWKSTMSYMGGKEMDTFGDFFTPMVSFLQQWLRSIDDETRTTKMMMMIYTQFSR